MRKKEYKEPTMEEFEFEQLPVLLAGSNEATKSAEFDNYEDGEFSWDE